MESKKMEEMHLLFPLPRKTGAGEDGGVVLGGEQGWWERIARLRRTSEELDFNREGEVEEGMNGGGERVDMFGGQQSSVHCFGTTAKKKFETTTPRYLGQPTLLVE